MLRLLSLAIALPLISVSCCDPQHTGHAGAEAVVAPSVGFVTGSVVTLRNSEGLYVVADPQVEGDTRNALVAGRDTADARSDFRLEFQENGTVAIRTGTGKYVCGDRDKDGLLLADRDYIGDWETFVLERTDDGKFSLKTTHGKFVTADMAAEGPWRGRLIANRDHVGDWEKFTIEEVLLP